MPPKLPVDASFDVERVREEYRAGRSLRALAKEVGCSHVHVWRVLKASGESVRPKAAPRHPKMEGGRRELALVQSAHAVILFQHGVSVAEIAFSLRHTAAWVLSKLKESGVNMKEQQ